MFRSIRAFAAFVCVSPLSDFRASHFDIAARRRYEVGTDAKSASVRVGVGMKLAFNVALAISRCFPRVFLSWRFASRAECRGKCCAAAINRVSADNLCRECRECRVCVCVCSACRAYRIPICGALHCASVMPCSSAPGINVSERVNILCETSSQRSNPDDWEEEEARGGFRRRWSNSG